MSLGDRALVVRDQWPEERREEWYASSGCACGP